VARELGAAGVEILFWASVYWGGFPLRIYAYENRCFVVSSQNRAFGYLIDKTGHLLAESGTYRNVAAADVDLEETVFCTDSNTGRLDDIKRRYGKDVVITTRHIEADRCRRAVPCRSLAGSRGGGRLAAATGERTAPRRLRERRRLALQQRIGIPWGHGEHRCFHRRWPDVASAQL